MLTKSIDLHVHSNKSDGTYSPSELVDYAMQKGLAAIALTDHDTVDGLDEIIHYAERLRSTNTFSAEENKSCNGHNSATVPEVIPGIEFSTEYEGKDVHILGLYIDYKSEDFQKPLQEFVNSRNLRNEKMCKLLQTAGIDITFDDSVTQQVATVGFDATYGARPLRREIQNSIEDLISERILDGSIKGGDALRCSYKNGEYVFS